MPPHTSFATGLATDVIVGPAVLYINDTTPFGSSTGGGFRFDPGHSFSNLASDVDGVQYPVQGLDRKVGGVPRLSGTLVNLNITSMLDIEPGASNSTVTTETTTTPQAVGALLASGDYVTDVRAVFQRGDGTFFAVKFPVGLIVKYDLAGAGANEKGAITIEIEARQPAADVASGVVPYKLYFGAANTLGES